MKKFKYLFPKKIYILYCITFAVILGLSIYNILKLANVGKLFSFYPALDIFSLIVCGLIIAALTITICFSTYTISDKYLLLNLVFSRTKISFDEIIMIRQETGTKITFVYFQNKKNPEEPSMLAICIRKEEIDIFIKELSDLVPDVTVDFFTMDKEK